MKYGSSSARRAEILARLELRNFASITDLARQMAVSEMTIRRDLRQMDAEGSLLLVHGGAASRQGSRDGSFDSRQMVNNAAKRAIARHAAGWIGDNDSIGLDAGTTAYALSSCLPPRFNGCVVTPSIPVMQVLMERETVRVIMLGGDLHRASRACIGPSTVEAAARLRLRTFFLGAAAIDHRGVYVATDLERPAKQELMRIADRVVLLADHAKFGLSAPVLLCPPSAIHALITDQEVPTVIAKAFSRPEQTIHIAPPANQDQE